MDATTLGKMYGYQLRMLDLGFRFIPKTASSSIKHSLYEIEYCKSYVAPPRTFPNHVKAPETYSSKIHIHGWANGNRTGDISPFTRRMIVLRDPVKRFISAYGDRVNHHQQLSKYFLDRRFPDLSDKTPEFNPSISTLIRNFEFYYQVDPIRHHMKPVKEFLNGCDMSFFTDIFKFENLQDFQKELSLIAGKDVRIPHRKKNPKTNSLSDISETELDFLIDFYACDYELFKDHYTADDIKKEWKALKN